MAKFFVCTNQISLVSGFWGETILPPSRNTELGCTRFSNVRERLEYLVQNEREERDFNVHGDHLPNGNQVDKRKQEK